jgi:hypothetical protein
MDDSGVGTGSSQPVVAINQLPFGNFFLDVTVERSAQPTYRAGSSSKS